MVDVVFVNPPASGRFLRELNRCSKRSIFGEVWPQTALAYLSSFLQRSGFSTAIVDCIAERVGIRSLLRRLGSLSPRFVVMMVATTTFYGDSFAARRIKAEVGCTVCAVGAHVSALPLEALLCGFDLVIKGEAELALLDVARGKPVGGIRGVCSLRGGKLVDNGFGALVDDLDWLGAPDRSQLPGSKYRMPLFEGRFATIMPSRGCPFSCSFCRTKPFYGSSFRLRTPGNVADEVIGLCAEGTRNFFFQADTFTASRRWVLAFCGILRREGLDLSWASNSRVDRFGSDVASAMASAGCRLVTFGVESGSQAILDSLNKGITPAQSARAVRNADSAGIMSAAHFILGAPDEDLRTASDTVRFSLKLRPHFATFNYATPYPGTQLRSAMEREHCILSNDWSLYDNFHSSVVRTKHLDGSALSRIRKKALILFYSNPAYQSKLLAGLDLGGAGTLLRVALGFAREEVRSVLLA